MHVGHSGRFAAPDQTLPNCLRRTGVQQFLLIIYIFVNF